MWYATELTYNDKIIYEGETFTGLLRAIISSSSNVGDNNTPVFDQVHYFDDELNYDMFSTPRQVERMESLIWRMVEKNLIDDRPAGQKAWDIESEKADQRRRG